MNLRESLSIALESLVANKMRAVLTMLGVIIGVGAVIAMLALASGARNNMMTQIQQMGTNVLIVMNGQGRQGPVFGGVGSQQSLTLDDAKAIADECPSVAATSPEVGQNAQIKYRNVNTNTTVLGTNPDYLGVRNYHIASGSFITDIDVKGLRKVAVIGPTTAKSLFGDSDPIGKLISIRGVGFEIIGVTAIKGAGMGHMDPDDQIFIPVTTAMRRLFGIQYVRAISIQATTMEKTTQATDELTQLLRKRHRLANDADDDFRIMTQAEIMQMANQTATMFTLLLAGIASVSLLVGGIGIMNIMLVSVTERTREIGIRKALGARRRDIQLQFLVEALVLSMAGGAIGILLGMAGAWGAGKALSWNTTPSLTSILLSFGFAAFVGIFFGFYPARKASRLDPVDALRYE
ncbi:MAG: ABC transporter permease [bacterium]